MDNKISLSPYVIRFSWVYAAFLIAAIIIINLLQMSSNTGLAIGILMASAVTAGQRFITDNKRVLNASEKLHMTFYSLLIAILISATLAFAFLMWSGIELDLQALFLEMSGSFSSRTIWMIIGLAGLLHFAVLYIAYSFVHNMIYKGMVKRGEV